MRTLIYSNLFIALCAAMLTLGSYGLVDAIPDPYLVLHVFGVTLMAYNVQRLEGLRKFTNRTEQTRWYLSHKWMLYTALSIGMLLSTWTFVHLPIELLMKFAPLAVISFFYALPVVPTRNGGMSIRNIPGAKIFLIAGVWTGVTLVLPIQEVGSPWTTTHMLWAVERFLFILAITLPFDIRDLKYDPDSLKTIPQRIGYSRAKQLAVLMLICCAFIHLFTVFGMHVGEPPHWTQALPALLYAMTAWAVSRMHTESPDFFFTGFLDATMLILGLILILT